MPLKMRHPPRRFVSHAFAFASTATHESLLAGYFKCYSERPFLLVCFLQIIVIIKHILEKKLGRKDYFQMSGIDAMILSFVRSVFLLPCCYFFVMKQEQFNWFVWRKLVLMPFRSWKKALTVPNYQNMDWNDQKFSSKRIIIIILYIHVRWTYVL